MSGSDTTQPGQQQTGFPPLPYRERTSSLMAFMVSLRCFLCVAQRALPGSAGLSQRSQRPLSLRSSRRLFKASAVCLECLAQRDLPGSVSSPQSWQKPAILRAVRHLFLAVARCGLSVSIRLHCNGRAMLGSHTFRYQAVSRKFALESDPTKTPGRWAILS